VLARLEDAPRPVPRVGRRERQAAEANVDRAIEIAAGAAGPDDILAGPPAFPFDQPIGVYHG
jgi:hypothetical protein